jgi:hypothetical protein
MAKEGWTPMEVMQDHRHDLISQEFMTAVELATCRVPEDPTSPVPARGYLVACMAFY